MKTIEVKLYKFSELSEEAKQRAIEKHWDINVNYEWWDSVYEDAKEVLIKIEGFDIDRGAYCQIRFIETPFDTAQKILSSHGDMCETYKTAQQFIADYDSLVEKYSDGVNKSVVSEGNEYDFDNELDELEEEFKKTISEDYRVILSNNYDYLTSDEAIIEAIEANDYDFTEGGEIY